MVSIEELLQPDKAPLLGVALAIAALVVGTICFVSTRKPKRSYAFFLLGHVHKVASISICFGDTFPFCKFWASSGPPAGYGYSGDSNAADYHDLDVSPMFLMGELPLGSTYTDSAYLNVRGKSMIRYKEKKKARMYKKKIRYTCKARAHGRKCVKLCTLREFPEKPLLNGVQITDGTLGNLSSFVHRPRLPGKS